MGKHSANERGSRVAKADGSDQTHGKHRAEDQRKTSGGDRSERSGWSAGRDNPHVDTYTGRDE